MNCKSCQVVAQVSWKTILELFTLLHVQFGILVNPITSFWKKKKIKRKNDVTKIMVRKILFVQEKNWNMFQLFNMPISIFFSQTKSSPNPPLNLEYEISEQQ